MGRVHGVMTKSALLAAIAESCEVKRGVASKALSTLASIAVEETKKNGKFKIPDLVTIKTRKKAGKREMFGKTVLVKAKPAKTVVKAFPAKVLKDEFRGLLPCTCSGRSSQASFLPRGYVVD